jgi:hypothetical protein
MGEVHRAKDTRLERTVAIKVLPERFSGSAETRQRFEREAKTISQLSHPHICALYEPRPYPGIANRVVCPDVGAALAGAPAARRSSRAIARDPELGGP